MTGSSANARGGGKRADSHDKATAAGTDAPVTPSGPVECDAREFLLHVVMLDPFGAGKRWAMTPEGMVVHGVA